MPTYFVFLPEWATIAQAGAVAARLDRLSMTDPQFNGATFDVLRDVELDCAWIDCRDELKGAALLAEVNAAMRGEA
jgi:hypothetical protein